MLLYKQLLYNFANDKADQMQERYEYMVLHLKKSAERGWVIEYFDDTYPRESHLQAMMDYLGLDGWQLTTSTGTSSEERLYFQRPYERALQEEELQKRINEIDANANTHFVEKSLIDNIDSAEDQHILKQKVLAHLYAWLKRHDFVWGEPGTGVKESHYLNRMEDVTGDPLFPEHHGQNKVSTRIDIFKEENQLRIELKRRITGSWIEFSQHVFPYTKEGLKHIHEVLPMEHFRLIAD